MGFANLPIVVGITTIIKHCFLDLLLASAGISFCCSLALLPPEDSECVVKALNDSTILWPYIIKALTGYIVGCPITVSAQFC